VIRGIIFDCFGVIIANDMKARIEAARRVNPETADRLYDVLKAADRGMITRQEQYQQMADLMGVDKDELEQAMTQSFVRNDALLGAIRELKGRFKIGLLSNVTGEDRLRELIGQQNVDELFDTVVASGDVGLIKPEREVYELTAQRLGLAPEDCVMVDDTESFCEGARTVGMEAVLFRSTEQALRDLDTLIDERG
jgi:putative hydrolase of the HAD superfamily